MNNTEVIIIAAGSGTRLRPLTEKVPKALLPIWGRKLIDYAFYAFARKSFYLNSVKIA